MFRPSHHAGGVDSAISDSWITSRQGHIQFKCTEDSARYDQNVEIWRRAASVHGRLDVRNIGFYIPTQRSCGHDVHKHIAPRPFSRQGWDMYFCHSGRGKGATVNLRASHTRMRPEIEEMFLLSAGYGAGSGRAPSAVEEPVSLDSNETRETVCHLETTWMTSNFSRFSRTKEGNTRCQTWNKRWEEPFMATHEVQMKTSCRVSASCSSR